MECGEEERMGKTSRRPTSLKDVVFFLWLDARAWWLKSNPEPSWWEVKHRVGLGRGLRTMSPLRALWDREGQQEAEVAPSPAGPHQPDSARSDC